MDIKNLDSLMPSEMALQAELVGVSKVNMPLTKTLALSILAGAFIAFGAIFFTTVTAGSTMSYGITKLAGGIVFSLGLILTIVGGAELFTGNNLIIMAWASKKVSTQQIIFNWILVYTGNMLGAIFIVILMLLSRQYLFGSGVIGTNIMNIAKTKCELGFIQAISLGVLCNILVCLAVWLSYSVRSTAGKILSIVFPIAGFVAAGFEHSVANMYFIPIAILIKQFGDHDFLLSLDNTAQNYESITWNNFLLNNLLPVTIGNLVGGALLVGLVYWFVYLKTNKKEQ